MEIRFSHNYSFPSRLCLAQKSQQNRNLNKVHNKYTFLKDNNGLCELFLFLYKSPLI